MTLKTMVQPGTGRHQEEREKSWQEIYKAKTVGRKKRLETFVH
jgi:hypothetical protein